MSDEEKLYTAKEFIKEVLAATLNEETLSDELWSELHAFLKDELE